MEFPDIIPVFGRLEAPPVSLRDQLRQKPLTGDQKQRLPKAIKATINDTQWCLIANEHHELFRYDDQAIRFEKNPNGVVAVKRFNAGTRQRWLLVKVKQTTEQRYVSSSEAAPRSAAVSGPDEIQRPTPAQIEAAAKQFSSSTDGAKQPSICFSAPARNSTIKVSADPSKWQGPITFNLLNITVQPGESATTLAQKHYGQPNPELIYKTNASYSKTKPPVAGDVIQIRDGAAIEFSISTRNVGKAVVTASGAVTNTLSAEVNNQGSEYTETSATLIAKTGTYVLKAESEGVFHQLEFSVEVEPAPTDWIKVLVQYDDSWQTALPLSNLAIQVNGMSHQSQVQLNAGTGNAQIAQSREQAHQTADEAGALVIDELPMGDVTVVMETDEALEAAIQSETDDLIRSLDSVYRALVTDMSDFQQSWDEWGYASIALDGTKGLVEGGKGWLTDQADLFEAQTWKALGSAISTAATKTIDVTAAYASDTYSSIKTTAQELGDAIHDQDLGNWQWWQTQADEAIEAARDTAEDYAEQVKAGVEGALEVMDSSQEVLKKLLRHKEAIIQLPELMARGDVNAVEHFVDTVLADIDPELAKNVKTNPDFHIVLALLNDSDTALTYMAYTSLIMEAVPPNFYAFTGGKGGAYVAIEVLLLVLMSFLTLGTGTAARVTTLVAKLSARSANLAKATQKVQKAKQALDRFINAIEEIADCSKTLKSIGEKLVKARNKDIKLKGKSGSTLAAKRESTKRDPRCRICKSEKHSTPNKLKGNVQAA